MSELKISLRELAGDHWPADPMEHAIYCMAVVGRAHLHGGLHVAETLHPVQRAEVMAVLDNLAYFADLCDNEQGEAHEHQEE